MVARKSASARPEPRYRVVASYKHVDILLTLDLKLERAAKPLRWTLSDYDFRDDLRGNEFLAATKREADACATRLRRALDDAGYTGRRGKLRVVALKPLPSGALDLPIGYRYMVAPKRRAR